jgi:hypothetical protein
MPLGCGITTLIFEVCILNALGDHHFNSQVHWWDFNVSLNLILPFSKHAFKMHLQWHWDTGDYKCNALWGPHL